MAIEVPQEPAPPATEPQPPAPVAPPFEGAVPKKRGRKPKPSKPTPENTDGVENFLDQRAEGTGQLVRVYQPEELLTDKSGKTFETFYRAVVAVCNAHVPNLTTLEGRKELASLAYRVTRTKTAIDKARKEMTEEWRIKTAEVNDLGGRFVALFDDLAKKVRQPLTDYETADSRKQSAIADTTERLTAMVGLFIDATPDDIAAKIAEAEAMVFDPDVFEERLSVTEALRRQVIDSLKTSHERITREFALQEENRKLREQLAAVQTVQRAEEETAHVAEEEQHGHGGQNARQTVLKALLAAAEDSDDGCELYQEGTFAHPDDHQSVLPKADEGYSPNPFYEEGVLPDGTRYDLRNGEVLEEPVPEDERAETPAQELIIEGAKLIATTLRYDWQKLREDAYGGVIVKKDFIDAARAFAVLIAKKKMEAA